MLAHIARQEEKLKTDEHLVVLHLSHYYSLGDDLKRKENLPADSLVRDSYTEIEKKKDRCEFARPGIFVSGDRRGQTAWACTEAKCKDHKGRINTSSSSSSRSSGGEKSASEKKKMYDRKQELFDARVAEPVRRRTLKAILENIHLESFNTDKPEEAVWPLKRSYFEQMAWEHFQRVPSDTQRVMYEILAWEEILNIKTSGYGYGAIQQRKAVEFIGKMTDIELLRFHFLCAVAHHGENLNIYGGKDQSVILKLAEQHKVNYKLFDARERYKQNPAKKFSGMHARYLLQVLLGKNVKPPTLYGVNVQVEEGIGIISEIKDLEKALDEKGIHPYHDPVSGICTGKPEDNCMLMPTPKDETASPAKAKKSSSKKAAVKKAAKKSAGKK
jgi:hypothetical protein